MFILGNYFEMMCEKKHYAGENRGKKGVKSSGNWFNEVLKYDGVCNVEVMV